MVCTSGCSSKLDSKTSFSRTTAVRVVMQLVYGLKYRERSWSRSLAQGHAAGGEKSKDWRIGSMVCSCKRADSPNLGKEVKKGQGATERGNGRTHACARTRAVGQEKVGKKHSPVFIKQSPVGPGYSCRPPNLTGLDVGAIDGLLIRQRRKIG